MSRVIVTPDAGFVRLDFDPGEGWTKREPLILRDRDTVYQLAVELSEALHKAWPGADCITPITEALVP